MELDTTILFNVPVHSSVLKVIRYSRKNLLTQWWNEKVKKKPAPLISSESDVPVRLNCWNRGNAFNLFQSIFELKQNKTISIYLKNPDENLTIMFNDLEVVMSNKKGCQTSIEGGYLTHTKDEAFLIKPKTSVLIAELEVEDLINECSRRRHHLPEDYQNGFVGAVTLKGYMNCKDI